MRLRVTAQDYPPPPVDMYGEVSALYQALLEARGKYSTVTIMRYASNALDLQYLVSVVLDPKSPDTIFTSEESVYVGARNYEGEIVFVVSFPTLNQNYWVYDEKKYDFNFTFDAKTNVITPFTLNAVLGIGGEFSSALSPQEFLDMIEKVLQENIQKDLDENTDPKIKEVLLERDSNFVNDCSIQPMTAEVTNWWVQNLYPTLKLQKPTGVGITLWETLFSGFDFEKEPQYIKTALFNILREDMGRYFPNIIADVVKSNPTIIDIGNQLISFKSLIKEELASVVGQDYVFYESNYNRTILHKRIPDDFKPKEPKYYVHIMNKDVKDPVWAVQEFMAITGEVAASDLSDEFYHTRKATFAAVLYGLANAEFPHDVYSHINEETGLREVGQQRGEDRTEAWVVPANMTLIGIITDIPGFQEKLVEAKIPIYDVDIESLSPEKTEGVWWDRSDRISKLEENERDLGKKIWDVEQILSGEDLFSDSLTKFITRDFGSVENYLVFLKGEHDKYRNLLKEVQDELIALKDNPEQYQQMEDISKQFGLEFYGKKRVCPHIRVYSYDQTVDEVKEFLEQRDDLRKPKYRGNPNPYAGHCYVATEVLYYLLGGKEAGWHPMFIKHEEEPHWFLQNDDGTIVDPTAEQFETPVPYDEAVGKGFLTNYPSARAQQVIDGMSGE